MFPQMVEFLIQKRFPANALPVRHQRLFSSLIPIEPTEDDETSQPPRKRKKQDDNENQLGGKIKKIKWISNIILDGRLLVKVLYSIALLGFLFYS